MMAISSTTPLWATTVSLIAALLIVLSRRMPNLRDAWTLLAGVVKFALVASMAPTILRGDTIVCHLVTMAPGLSLDFRVDALGEAFALTASFLWIVTSIYSIGYVRAEKEHAQTRYFACFALALSATMGAAFSANMLTAFVFYEILTLCTFPLVGHKETDEALRGARKYLTYLLGTSLTFFMAAVVLTYVATGTLDFRPTGIFGTGVSRTLVTVAFVLYVLGVTKAAMMPLHGWLPAAMVAPTPVSALLHAVAVVKTGVFLVVRMVVDLFGVQLLSRYGLGPWLAAYASLTIVLASVIALRQDNLKRRLAYSTVSQLSYIVLGAALLSPSGISGSVLHIAVHAFAKITLFFGAGAIYVATHKTRVSELDGIGRRMPFTMGAFTVAALSMIGVPPMAGLVSKWYLVQGAVEADTWPVLVVLGLSTLLNAGYFLPIVYRAFFVAPTSSGPSGATGVQEAPLPMVAALCVTAAGVLVLFFVPSIFLELAHQVARTVAGGVG